MDKRGIKVAFLVHYLRTLFFFLFCKYILLEFYSLSLKLKSCLNQTHLAIESSHYNPEETFSISFSWEW